MQRLKYLAIMFLALMLTGCGQKVQKHLNLEYQHFDAPAMGMTAVILPFADYTNSNDIASAFRRNLQLSESLMDNLAVQGFNMPVSEDIFQYLVDQGIVKMAGYTRNANISVVNELSNDWSEVMKGELRRYLHQQEAAQGGDVNGAGTHALTTEEIVKLGRQFNADYIIRGRILEYRTRQENTWDPIRRGLFPVVTGGTSRMLYGFAGTDSYDNINQMVAGGLLGLGIGSFSDWPFADDNIFIDGGLTKNELGWAAAGSAAGYLSTKSGQVDQAVVRIRMWVQEASTGEVVWTNSAMARVSPRTVFSDDQYDDMFHTAIEKSVTSLVQSFSKVVL